MRQSTSLQAVEDADLRRVMEYLRSHFRDALTFGGVCRGLRLNRRSLERKFAAHLRETPAESLTRIRLDAARTLLVDTNLPAAIIAERCGFGTPERFSTNFRQAFGISPIRYRRRFLDGEHTW